LREGFNRRRKRIHGGGNGDGGGGRSRKSGFDCGFSFGLFFFLQTDVSVAFGTEIHCGGATEEAAVVGAESVTFGSLASVFFGHVWICKKRKKKSDL